MTLMLNFVWPLQTSKLAPSQMGSKQQHIHCEHSYSSAIAYIFL